MKKKKNPDIYSTFLGTTSSYGCICKLKKKKYNEYSYLQTFLQIYKQINFSFSTKKKKKILQRIPVLYYENIVKVTDVNVSIYVNKHACI